MACAVVCTITTLFYLPVARALSGDCSVVATRHLPYPIHTHLFCACHEQQPPRFLPCARYILALALALLSANFSRISLRCGAARARRRLLHQRLPGFARSPYAASFRFPRTTPWFYRRRTACRVSATCLICRAIWRARALPRAKACCCPTAIAPHSYRTTRLVLL